MRLSELKKIKKLVIRINFLVLVGNCEYNFVFVFSEISKKQLGIRTRVEVDT